MANIDIWKDISLSSYKLPSWLKVICDEQEKIAKGEYRDKNVRLLVDNDADLESFTPIHFVTLACLVLLIKKRGCQNERLTTSSNFAKMLKDDLHFDEYFGSDIAHIASRNKYTLNLWKVETTHALAYSQHIANYLKRTYFQDKDLSGLKVILDELYANIADHAEADGVAYSFIKYQEKTGMMTVAVCDFGIGIEKSLKKGANDISENYIESATRKGVSAKSNTHNRGFGLDTVTSCVSAYGGTLRILSGRELYISPRNRENQRTLKIPFDFKGTLIYFRIPVVSFETEDYVEDFEL